MANYNSSNTGVEIDAVIDEVQALSGAVVGTTDVQSLTNKTIGIAGDITGTGNIDITGTIDASGNITSDGSVFVNQDGSGTGLIVDHDGASGAAANFSNNNSGNFTVEVTAQNSGGGGMSITNAGTANGLFIDQNGDGIGLEIDSEATSGTSNTIQVRAADATGGYMADMRTNDGLRRVSLGHGNQHRMGYFYRNLGSADTAAPVVEVVQTNTGDDQRALLIQQDGTGDGVFIDQNGNGYGLRIDTESTSLQAIRVEGSKYGLRVDQNLSGGYAGYFYRNIAEAGSNPLVTINEDNTASTQDALNIQQDGTGAGINLAGGAIVGAEVDNGNSSTADTIAWNAGNIQKSTLTGNCTYTFTAPSNDGTFMLKLVQDATGSRTVTWPASVKWPGGTAPTLSTAANAIDIITFMYDGTNYFAVDSLNFS